MRQIILCDARTVVGNGDERAAIFRPAGQIDLTFCVADRVGNEIAEQIEELSCLASNIVIKYGRYIPGQTPHYDEVLGVKLASDNQYAERIS